MCEALAQALDDWRPWSCCDQLATSRLPRSLFALLLAFCPQGQWASGKAPCQKISATKSEGHGSSEFLNFCRCTNLLPTETHFWQDLHEAIRHAFILLSNSSAFGFRHLFLSYAFWEPDAPEKLSITPLSFNQPAVVTLWATWVLCPT